MALFIIVTVGLHLLFARGQHIAEFDLIKDLSEQAQPLHISTPIIEHLQKQIKDLQTTDQQQQKQIEELQQSRYDCEDDATENSTNLSGRRWGYVAFTAVRANTLSHIGLNQVIPFETVIYNRGRAYDNYHGLFIAPRAGIYLFSVTILHMPHGQSMHAGIMLSGRTIAKVHATGGVWDEGSQTVIVPVREGEKVWVQNQDYTNQHVYGDLYSSFSGVLLKRF
ncbi:collagen alpha-1(X) chain-like [Dreissena polymorpha]|uniref:C1q domain-containing protein n=1 Tax=Dreissena polymorpha TaxID=45954 RepID=A0A9D4KSK7_DREPO|nr:collagen alpha-1(X) chain-like [Dreissena polymorpha]KAH3845270.1 hypothetical protein DPMN_087545 [Dreissena polymorpha]